MHPTIESELSRIEQHHNVKIIYACEAGSRIWQWDRIDGSSDYDVRFIYVHDLPYYFSVAKSQNKSIVCEGDVIDLAGLEVGHALGLLANSNPNVIEQLYSPIVYRADYATDLRLLAKKYFKSIAAYHHYLSLAKGNWRDWQKKFLSHAANSAEIKPLKKLIVVVRANLLLKALTDRGFAYAQYISKNGIYYLAEQYMTPDEKLSFHICVLALRGIAERDEAAELAMCQWVKGSLYSSSTPAPTAPLESKDLDEINNFFRSIVLMNNKEWMGNHE